MPAVHGHSKEWDGRGSGSMTVGAGGAISFNQRTAQKASKKITDRPQNCLQDQKESRKNVEDLLARRTAGWLSHRDGDSRQTKVGFQGSIEIVPSQSPYGSELNATGEGYTPAPRPCCGRSPSFRPLDTGPDKR